jgi:hypothetical protein
MHSSHKWQTSIPAATFEPTILVTERSQSRALDRAASGIGILIWVILAIVYLSCVLYNDNVYMFTIYCYMIRRLCLCNIIATWLWLQ